MKTASRASENNQDRQSRPMWTHSGQAQPIQDADNDHEDALGEADNDVPGSSNVKSQPKEDGSAAATQPKRKRPLKLTASQRERKRAIDREAQRSIRIKTKNYIAHLESLVKAMEQSDTNGPDGENNRSRELMNQLRQSQEEVRRLREAMLGVQRVLGGALGDATRNALNAGNMDHRQPSSSSSPPSGNELIGPPGGSFGTTAHPSIEAAGTFWMPPPDPLNPPSAVPVLADQSSPPSIHPARPDKDPKLRQYEGEMFYYAEYHLGRIYNAPPGPGAFGNRPFDEDIIVRAVIEGWPAVEERYSLDLGWQVLQEIDQVIFPDVGIVERMAALRLLRMKLLHNTGSRPSPQNVPPYMVSEVMHHDTRSKVVDAFVWPGFRKLLIEEPQRYITNEFNESFRHNLKFLWPFDISESYTKDSITSLYCSAPEFMRRQADIRCWTMKRIFFNGYEELYPIVPAYEADIQKSLPAPGMPSGMASQPQSATSVRARGSFGMHSGQPMGMVEDQEVEGDLSDASGPGPTIILSNDDPSAWANVVQPAPMAVPVIRHPHLPSHSPVTPISAGGGYWSASGMDHHQHNMPSQQAFAGQAQPMQGMHMGHRQTMAHGYHPP